MGCILVQPKTNKAIPASFPQEENTPSLLSKETGPTLTVSIVTFAPDLELLTRCVASLNQAINVAHHRGVLATTSLIIIDNGPGDQWLAQLRDMGTELDARAEFALPIRYLSGHGNIGFGAGHNLAITQSKSDFHLILNPDVILCQDAIANGITFMQQHARVGVVTPRAESAPGIRQYLCRTYPTLFDLFLRGFAPMALRRLFAERLAALELQEKCGEIPAMDVAIISGCFMLYRTELLQRLHGFSEEYFLYFEDFDLSLRTKKLAQLAYVPSVRIIHAGGNAGRKGWRHIRMFISSAWTFMNQHGWCLW